MKKTRSENIFIFLGTYLSNFLLVNNQNFLRRHFYLPDKGCKFKIVKNGSKAFKLGHIRQFSLLKPTFSNDFFGRQVLLNVFNQTSKLKQSFFTR